MTFFDEVTRAIHRLRDEKPTVFHKFCSQFENWESWRRAPYGARRADLEQFLCENGVLDRGLDGSHTRDKRFVIEFPIEIPSGSPWTLTGAEFLRRFTGTFYLFRRAGRFFGTLSPILISRIEINGKEPLNYTETREGRDRTSTFKQQGIAYLTQGSLLFLAVDERGHPSLASFAHVNPEQTETQTPILDGHLLASTIDPPDNANFVVRTMLVRAIDRAASTGIFNEDDEAIAEFQKLRPLGWKEERWASAFNERFNATAPVRWDGNYFKEFNTHQKFEA